FGRAAAWFAGLAGAHGVGTVWTSDTGMLLALVLVCFAIVRVCPNSLELPLGYLRALPQAGLAVATGAALLLMNYGSRVLFFPFLRRAAPRRHRLFSAPPPAPCQPRRPLGSRGPRSAPAARRPRVPSGTRHGVLGLCRRAAASEGPHRHDPSPPRRGVRVESNPRALERGPRREPRDVLQRRDVRGERRGLHRDVGAPASHRQDSRPRDLLARRVAVQRRPRPGPVARARRRRHALPRAA